MKRLQGKSALVTGAARGIGLAIAQRFAEEGARVFLSDINDEAGRLAAERIGADSAYIHLDVADEASWQKVAAELGSLDIVVNNAGITGFLESPGPHDPENLDLASWHKVHATNLDGVALGCKYAIQLCKGSQAASIVNISSRSGMVGIPGAAAYASSKAAVRNHSKSVALYCAEQGYAIRCNSIHPAAIMTPMWEPMLGTGPEREANEYAMVADTPMKRFGEPQEIAALAVLLASDEVAYMTGSELTVDGGLLAGSAATPG